MRERRSAERIDQRRVALVEGSGASTWKRVRLPLPGRSRTEARPKDVPGGREHIGALSIAAAAPSEREFAHASAVPEAAAGSPASRRRPRRGLGSTTSVEASQIVDNRPKPGLKLGHDIGTPDTIRAAPEALFFRAFLGAIEGLQISLAAPFFPGNRLKFLHIFGIAARVLVRGVLLPPGFLV